MVDHNKVKARLYQGPRNSRDLTRMLQSPCGTILTSFRLDFISVDVSASVNTKAEQEQIKALYSSMKTTSNLIDISLYAPFYLLTLRLDSSLI
jgi:hypothetical protein